MRLKYLLKLWGVLCLVIAAFVLCMSLYAASSPITSFEPGCVGLGEWIGMGLLCLGAARIIDLLEKK